MEKRGSGVQGSSANDAFWRTLGPRYVSGPRLLDILFDDESRPSLRTLRSWQASRLIPHVRVGRLVYFDPAAVKVSLEGRRSVRLKPAA